MYTDSNGREMIERKRDYRPTWDLDVVDEKEARNYFPGLLFFFFLSLSLFIDYQYFYKVNAAATIKDSNAQLSVVIDRSEGVASLADGEMEFMLHRRLGCDDSRGAGESLNEVGSDGRGLKVR